MYAFTVFRHALLFPLPTIQRYAMRIAHTVRFHRRKRRSPWRTDTTCPALHPRTAAPFRNQADDFRQQHGPNGGMHLYYSTVRPFQVFPANLNVGTAKWTSCKTPRRFNPQIKSSRPSHEPVAPFRQSISTQSYPRYVVKASFSTAFKWPTPTEVWCLKPPLASLIIFSGMSGTWQTPAQPK